jgi:hypothetical protein
LECIAHHLLVAKKSETDIETQALVVETALASLLTLVKSARLPEPALSDAVLLQITTYTNASDPWTTENASATARLLLKTQLTGDKLSQFITGTLLRDYFRPLFIKSPSGLTSSGRPSHYKDATEGTSHNMQTPSWKTGEGEGVVMSRFEWAVESSDVRLEKGAPLQIQWLTNRTGSPTGLQLAIVHTASAHSNRR